MRSHEGLRSGGTNPRKTLVEIVMEIFGDLDF